jgi:iron-sulfur cluster assembly protein
MAVEVSERAIAEIKKASGTRAQRPKGLRVGIRGGGCTGFSYLFEWSDTEPRAEDKVLSFENGDVRVFIDPKSFIYLDGSTLEYSTSLVARGFKFVNPKVKSTCGCGESVSF